MVPNLILEFPALFSGMFGYAFGLGWLDTAVNAWLIEQGALDIHAGGVIGLVRQSGRLRFEVNRGVAQSAGLRLSADLLSLAMTVFDGSARHEGTL